MLIVERGFALTDNFMADVGITQDWFNVGQQVLAAGLSLLEVILPDRIHYYCQY